MFGGFTIDAKLPSLCFTLIRLGGFAFGPKRQSSVENLPTRCGVAFGSRKTVSCAFVYAWWICSRSQKAVVICLPLLMFGGFAIEAKLPSLCFTLFMLGGFFSVRKDSRQLRIPSRVVGLLSVPTKTCRCCLCSCSADLFSVPDRQSSFVCPAFMFGGFTIRAKVRASCFTLFRRWWICVRPEKAVIS